MGRDHIMVKLIEIWSGSINNKVYFRGKNITRDKESRFMMINWPIHQNDELSVGASNSRVPK